MENIEANIHKKTGVKEYFWMFSITLFFTVCLNYDWRQSFLVWYGSIFLLAVAYLVAYNGRFAVKDSGFITWFLSFMALCTVSLAWSISASTGMVIVKSLFVLLIVFSFLQFSVNYGFDLDKIIACLFVAILINIFYVVTVIDLTALGEVQLGKAMIDGWNGNGIGFMAGEGVLAAFYLFDKSRGTVRKIFFLASIVFLSVIVMFTGSRTAFVMLLAGIVLYFYIKFPTKIFRNIIITLILLYAALYMMMNVESIYNVLGSRFEGLFALFSGEGEVDSSSSIRDEFMRNGKQWFFEEPFLGYGVNNYKELNVLATGKFTYAHNNFIEIAVDFGIIGLAWYYLVYLYLIIKMLKQAKNNRLIAFLLASLLSSLISQYGTVSYYDLYQNLLLFLCFAATNHQKQKRSNVGI